MTEYWRSSAKHYCKICNKWISGHAKNIKHHESSNSHKWKLENSLKKNRRAKQAAQRGAQPSGEIARIEAAAVASFRQHDLGVVPKQSVSLPPPPPPSTRQPRGAAPPRQEHVSKKRSTYQNRPSDDRESYTLSASSDVLAYYNRKFRKTDGDGGSDDEPPPPAIRKLQESRKDGDGGGNATIEVVVDEEPEWKVKARAAAEAQLSDDARNHSTGIGSWEVVTEEEQVERSKYVRSDDQQLELQQHLNDDDDAASDSDNGTGYGYHAAAPTPHVEPNDDATTPVVSFKNRRKKKRGSTRKRPRTLHE